jgi:hypothetical protein
MNKKPTIKITMTPLGPLGNHHDLLPEDWEEMSEQEISDNIHDLLIEEGTLHDLFNLGVEVKKP